MKGFVSGNSNPSGNSSASGATRIKKTVDRKRIGV
jgi:hypothetical protein